MMTTVNPPPIPRRPPEFVLDANRNAYFEAIEKILYQLWLTSPSGTLTDDSQNSTITGLLFPGLSDFIEGPYAHSVSSSYTTIGNEIIDASGTITITLDEPGQVKVNHQGAYNDVVSITDGTNTDYLHVPGDSVIYSYSVDLGRWL